MRLLNEDIIRELQLRLDSEKSMSIRVKLKRLIKDFKELD
jgi:flagellin-specific chaperone FliS